MPLKICAINMKTGDPDANELIDDKWSYHPYTVYVGEHRILTVYTESYRTTTKYLQDVQKSPPNNHKHGCILVGVCADHNPDLIRYDSRLHNYPDPENIPHHLLQISTGSHCFLLRLPSRPSSDHVPKALQSFFSNPRVIAVGMKMKSLSKRLEGDFGIKFANPVDLNELAVKGMKRDDLDLGRYDLDRLAKAVLGKHWDVMRREGYIHWFDGWWEDELTVERAEMATVDPFLCYMIGNELLAMMDDDEWYPKEFRKFQKMNKKYKKKKKGKEKKRFPLS